MSLYTISSVLCGVVTAAATVWALYRGLRRGVKWVKWLSICSYWLQYAGLLCFVKCSLPQRLDEGYFLIGMAFWALALFLMLGENLVTPRGMEQEVER